MPEPARDQVEVAEAAAHGFGAYVHLPFCEAVCPYCDFAVVAGQDDLTDRYLTAVETEIGRTDQVRTIDAAFFGGGTPSRVPGLGRLANALATHHGLSQGAEVTLEANPEDWTAEKASELVSAGFNRVSFGAQSFDSAVLEYLGRRHGPEHIVSAVEGARAAGFGSVSLDLIFGSPNESTASWRRTLDLAVAAEPDHVSTYALTVERGTELSRQVQAGAAAPDPDGQADKYEMAQEVLAAARYRQYEVSNYARAGHECRYNLGAWGQGHYLAFGMGAHGHLNGVRFRNIRRLEAYLAAIEAGESPRAAQDPTDDPAEERVVLGLRRSIGVSSDELIERFVASASGIRLVDAGVMAVRNGRLVVTRPLLTDQVLASFLAVVD